MDSILLFEALYEICRPFLYMYLTLGGTALIVTAAGVAVLIIGEVWDNRRR